jgi:hypothetical protein
MTVWIVLPQAQDGAVFDKKKLHFVQLLGDPETLRPRIVPAG